MVRIMKIVISEAGTNGGLNPLNSIVITTNIKLTPAVAFLPFNLMAQIVHKTNNIMLTGTPNNNSLKLFSKPSGELISNKDNKLILYLQTLPALKQRFQQELKQL